MFNTVILLVLACLYRYRATLCVKPTEWSSISLTKNHFLLAKSICDWTSTSQSEALLIHYSFYANNILFSISGISLQNTQNSHLWNHCWEFYQCPGLLAVSRWHPRHLRTKAFPVPSWWWRLFIVRGPLHKLSLSCRGWHQTNQSLVCVHPYPRVKRH